MGTPWCCPVTDNEPDQTKFLRRRRVQAQEQASLPCTAQQVRSTESGRVIRSVGYPTSDGGIESFPGAVTPPTIVADGSLAAARACNDHRARSSCHIERRRAAHGAHERDGVRNESLSTLPAAAQSQAAMGDVAKQVQEAMKRAGGAAIGASCGLPRRPVG